MNCKESELFPNARTCISIVRDNIDKFIKFNETDVTIDEFESDVDEAESIWDDKMERMDLKSLTSIKDEFLTKSFNWGRDLYLRVKLALSKNPNISIIFPSKDLQKSRYNDSLMISLLEILIKLAEDKSEYLAPHGLTPDVIQEGKDLLQNLRKSDYEQELKKLTRKGATDVRHKLYKKIYDKINSLNEMGRNIFADEPEKLRLFESPWTKYHKHKTIIFEGSILPESTIIVTEDLNPDTVLHVENIGLTDLLIFVNSNGETPEGDVIEAGTELTVEISELGEGKYLKLYNNNKINTGAYKIEI
ncbi:MAG: hypothetical protein GY756_27100 [bacterium]|nr:hypothetical protein [bacterium]